MVISFSKEVHRQNAHKHYKGDLQVWQQKKTIASITIKKEETKENGNVEIAKSYFLNLDHKKDGTTITRNEYLEYWSFTM